MYFAGNHGVEHPRGAGSKERPSARSASPSSSAAIALTRAAAAAGFRTKYASAHCGSLPAEQSDFLKCYFALKQAWEENQWELFEELVQLTPGDRYA